MFYVSRKLNGDRNICFKVYFNTSYAQHVSKNPSIISTIVFNIPSLYYNMSGWVENRTRTIIFKKKTKLDIKKNIITYTSSIKTMYDIFNDKFTFCSINLIMYVFYLILCELYIRYTVQNLHFMF